MYIHIITHITHVVNTYKHNYIKIPHKFGHIRVNFLQSVRLQVTQTQNMFRPNKPEQSYNQRTIPLQNP